MSLVCNRAIDADAFAYCDQDDVWDADRLERGLAWLNTVPPTTPALWCSRTRLIDHAGKSLGFAPLFRRPPGFRNALVQNIGGGNTMLFNRALRDVIAAIGPEPVVAHDWWTYKIATGIGGAVLYDSKPCLSYRQHGGNQIGANIGLSARAQRIVMLMRGRLSEWNRRDLAVLDRVTGYLTPENVQVLDEFRKLRSDGLGERLSGLSSGRFYRQTVAGQAALMASAMLRLV